jgi:hypothetical protein
MLQPALQEEYIKEEQKNLKRELLRAQEEVKRIQSVPLVIGQFLEMVNPTCGIVGSTTGSNYYVRILSTLNRELLKPSASVALHRFVSVPQRTCATMGAPSHVRPCAHTCLGLSCKLPAARRPTDQAAAHALRDVLRLMWTSVAAKVAASGLLHYSACPNEGVAGTGQRQPWQPLPASALALQHLRCLLADAMAVSLWQPSWHQTQHY